MPGIEKICSMMITPPIRNAVSSAVTVTNGISALRNACLHDHLALGTPFARAVRT